MMDLIKHTTEWGYRLKKPIMNLKLTFLEKLLWERVLKRAFFIRKRMVQYGVISHRMVLMKSYF